MKDFWQEKLPGNLALYLLKNKQMDTTNIKEVFKAIYERKLAIHAVNIYDGTEFAKLKTIIALIAPQGDKRWLVKRDTYFSYCNERHVWYGSESTHLPVISLDNFKEKNILIETETRRLEFWIRQFGLAKNRDEEDLALGAIYDIEMKRENQRT